MEDSSWDIWSTKMALRPPVRLSRTAHNQGIPLVDNDCLANASSTDEGELTKYIDTVPSASTSMSTKGIRVLMVFKYRRNLLNFRVSTCMSSHSLRGQHYHW